MYTFKPLLSRDYWGLLTINPLIPAKIPAKIYLSTAYPKFTPGGVGQRVLLLLWVPVVYMREQIGILGCLSVISLPLVSLGYFEYL